MSDLGQLLISISNKLSKMISRTNKLERNDYKFAKYLELYSNNVGTMPDKQFKSNLESLHDNHIKTKPIPLPGYDK